MKLCYHYILATLLAFTLAACSDEETDMPLSAGSTEVYVSVMLNVSGNTAEMTRAGYVASDDGTPDINMQDGLDYENAINDKDVELYVFDQEGTFVEKVLITWHTSGTWYGVLNTISQEDVTNGKHFHIVALCNHKGALNTNYSTPTAGTTTLDDFIASLSFSGYTQEFTKNLTMKDHQGADVSPSSTTYIPMWGIKSIQFAGQGLCTNVGEINVLRAMAKVRVAIGDQPQTDGFILNGCTLNVANQKGYLAAQKNGDIPQAYVATTDNNGIKTYTTAWNTDESVNPSKATPITTPSIYQESPIATTSTPLPFSKVTEEGNSCYVIYIPEYNHVKDDAETPETPQSPATITLSITQGEYEVKDQSGNDYFLHFADYSASTTPTAPEWDIIRNDIYDYTITQIESGGLKANVRVMPWEHETMGYELSQHAKVEIISAPSAEFNYTNGRYTNKTIYETDNYATFIIKVKEPKGVRWNAHLSNPYFFDFTVDTQDYGYGGDEVHTIKVKPTYPYNSTKELQTTDLFFTVETLRDREVQLTYAEADDVDDNDYGIAAGTRLHITQVSASAEEVGDETTPFTVASGLYDYTRRDTDLGLSQPEGIVTIQISDGKSGNGFANGVVMTEFKGNLYSMWQESAEVEDALDTHVKYASLSVATENNNKVNSNSIWSNSPSVLCNSSIIGNSGNTDIINKDIDFCSSGGWISTENQLYAFINCWETAQKTLDGGYACYRTSSDGTDWGTVTNVKMSGGGIMNGVIEQDPHVMENGRIITAAHFQQNNEGLYVSPIYTDDLTQGWKKAAFTHTTAYSYDSKTATYEVSLQSKEMEPSLFKRNNGSLVMIFRDNEQNKDAQSTYKLMASVSYDYGETWTKSVLTNMPDSRSKQCAGNLPDGTAYIVNNPVNDRNRWPLVITLSKDGFTFDTAYLLRSGTMMDKGTAWNGTDNQYPDVQTGTRSDGSWRYRGYHYPKAMVHGGYLYVSYSTNKEDVEYTRIPLSSIQLNDPSAR